MTSVSTGQGHLKWAWEDLNLRPHPYQLNAGNRCADRCLCRSRPTVGVEGMRSIGPLVCVVSLKILQTRRCGGHGLIE
jgi:hypothetical protein